MADLDSKVYDLKLVGGRPVCGRMTREIFNKETNNLVLFWWKTKTLINVIMGLNYILKLIIESDPGSLAGMPSTSGKQQQL